MNPVANTVFHIDDEQRVTESLLLRAPNLDVHPYQDVMSFGTDAAKKIMAIDRNRILCVLCDHNLPGIHGSFIVTQMGIINLVLEKQKKPSVPFIVHTGDSSKTTELFYTSKSRNFAGRILKTPEGLCPEDIELQIRLKITKWYLKRHNNSQ